MDGTAWDRDFRAIGKFLLVWGSVIALVLYLLLRH